jgi:hypothetical protein
MQPNKNRSDLGIQSNIKNPLFSILELSLENVLDLHINEERRKILKSDASLIDVSLTKYAFKMFVDYYRVK